MEKWRWKICILVNGNGIRNVIQTSNNMLFMFPLLRHLYGLPSQFFRVIIFLSSILFFARLNLKEHKSSRQWKISIFKKFPLCVFMMLCHLTLCLRRWCVSLYCCCYNIKYAVRSYALFFWLILCRLLISMDFMFGWMLHEMHRFHVNQLWNLLTIPSINKFAWAATDVSNSEQSIKSSSLCDLATYDFIMTLVPFFNSSMHAECCMWMWIFSVCRIEKRTKS